jgi:rare lipoprotein A
MSKLSESKIVNLVLVMVIIFIFTIVSTGLVLFSRLQTNLDTIQRDIEGSRHTLIELNSKLKDLNARVDKLNDMLKPLALQGIASWYGVPFHGRTTASGETYDMNGFTIAHKTLPLGTFVKLRNPVNGIEAVAIVNDRGPYIKGRDFDLSWALAKKLKFEKKGLQTLEVQILSQLGVARKG